MEDAKSGLTPVGLQKKRMVRGLATKKSAISRAGLNHFGGFGILVGKAERVGGNAFRLLVIIFLIKMAVRLPRPIAGVQIIGQ